MLQNMLHLRITDTLDCPAYAASAAELRHLSGTPKQALTYSSPSHRSILNCARGNQHDRADNAAVSFALTIDARDVLPTARPQP